MAQILCWDFDYIPNDKPENFVKVTDPEKILQYLTQTSVILFNQQIFQNHEHVAFLTLIKVSCPNTILVFVDGDFHHPFFECVSSNDLNTFIKNHYVRSFTPEDKKNTIKLAFDLLLNNQK